MLHLSNITKSQNGKILFKDASFQVNSGDKVGIVGPNGAGKTTFFRLITGEEKADTGQISLQSKARLAYFSQNITEVKGHSALDEVVSGDPNFTKLKIELGQYEQRLCDPDITEDEMTKVLEKMGDAQTHFEKIGGYDLESRAEEILTGLGIAPHDHQKDVGQFSGGWKMRIALAKTLVISPDIILMDEPTNYLDLETILWLEVWLQNYEGALLMTTHDRAFMNKVCKKIVEISNKKVTTYTGNYDFYEKEREIRQRNLKAEHARQQEMLSKEEDFIAKFKARASHAAQVQSRVKKLEKIDRIELPPEEDSMSFQFKDPPRGSDDVVVMNKLSKSFGEKNLFQDLDYTVARTEKIAVVGVNGSGKSTLLKIICNELEASSGKVSMGPSIKLGYFSQHSMDVLYAENTVFDELRATLSGATDGYIRNVAAAFLFKDDDIKKKIKFLSGGEKARIVLAKIFSQNNNLLVLDEPTNHLDIKSREILLETLRTYSGTVLFVSHDRFFLNELTQKVIEISDKGAIVYPGNYEYYLSKK